MRENRREEGKREEERSVKRANKEKRTKRSEKERKERWFGSVVLTTTRGFFKFTH